MKWRFVFRNAQRTRVVENHRNDGEARPLVDGQKALEYAQKLAKERNWELIAVEESGA